MKNLAALVIAITLAGCSTEQLYQAIGSPDPMGPPVRDPYDYPLCPPGTTLYPELGVKITGRGLATSAQGGGCGSDDGRPGIRKGDSANADPRTFGWQGIDRTGRGYSTAVAYAAQLVNEKYLRMEAEEKLRLDELDERNKKNLGRYYPDVVIEEEKVVINGLEWTRRITARYKTPAQAEPSAGELLAWYETYEHWIDDTHLSRRRGRYSAEVVADAEWLAARRCLLRTKVEATRIERMTQAEIDEAWVEYDRRREEIKSGEFERRERRGEFAPRYGERTTHCLPGAGA